MTSLITQTHVKLTQNFQCDLGVDETVNYACGVFCIEGIPKMQLLSGLVHRGYTVQLGPLIVTEGHEGIHRFCMDTIVCSLPQT